MIRLEITADTAAQFHDSLWRLFESLNPTRAPVPSDVRPNFSPKLEEGREDLQPFAVQPEPTAEHPRRGPGRPRKPKPESVTIEGTATEVRTDLLATADPSPAIIVPPDEPVVEATAEPAPFLALAPLKDEYTLDEVRKLAMDYVRAMVVDAKGNTDRDAARGVLKGLLGAFGVEGVGGLSESQRLSMVKLIHHLAPFSRTPPSTFGEIVASFGRLK